MKVSRIIMSFFILLCHFGLIACSKGEDADLYNVGFTYQVDPQSPHQVTFTNTSTGDYLYVDWDFGNGHASGKSTDKAKAYTAYYPLQGDYNVELRLWGPANNLADTKVVSQLITIEQDDPKYTAKENLIWSDEFNGSSINPNYWKLETGTGDNGWGNNELQSYTNGDNVEVKDGKLILTAKKVNDKKERGSYTSTRMISWGKQEFKYGRIEVRAKLPSGTGIWPAIWMLGSNLGTAGWPACGEIDIMEYVGYEPDVVHATVHTTDGSGSNGNGNSKVLTTCEEQFHIYGLYWTEDKLQFYIDTPDNIVHTYSPVIKTEANWPFDKPHFFILNVAVGGNWGGVKGVDNSIFPQAMTVDYVRVYQLD